ncbi:unnamed protein product [Pleuronectes platessa]|uniref:Uncharacterized protein n=1 Tax=Pleuronectes platessa TaxID=8262 RepID=A0A9N7V6E5_PLEPL|nr:unnamed protein product [Pleuronectes platessa]
MCLASTGRAIADTARADASWHRVETVCGPGAEEEVRQEEVRGGDACRRDAQGENIIIFIIIIIFISVIIFISIFISIIILVISVIIFISIIILVISVIIISIIIFMIFISIIFFIIIIFIIIIFIGSSCC